MSSLTLLTLDWNSEELMNARVVLVNAPNKARVLTKVILMILKRDLSKN